MTKKKFLLALSKGLKGLSKQDKKRTVEYYGEIIADRMEEGVPEEEAVSALGEAEEIAKQVLGEGPQGETPQKGFVSTSKMPVWGIVLLLLGSPLWIALLAAAVALLAAAYAVLFSLVFAVCVTGFALTVGGVGGAIVGIVALFAGNLASCALQVGCGLILAGVGILLLPLCKKAVKFGCFLGKALWRGIKRNMIKKEKSV